MKSPCPLEFHRLGAGGIWREYGCKTVSQYHVEVRLERKARTAVRIEELSCKGEFYKAKKGMNTLRQKKKITHTPHIHTSNSRARKKEMTLHVRKRESHDMLLQYEGHRRESVKR